MLAFGAFALRNNDFKSVPLDFLAIFSLHNDVYTLFTQYKNLICFLLQVHLIFFIFF